MHIAQVAPLTEAVPPKLYGGTERVVSWLTEELVALGHEVTLFASGDSVTSARLEAMWPRSLRLDGSVRDPNALHMVLLELVYRRASEFDLIHFHLDYYPFSLFSRQPTPIKPSYFAFLGRIAPEKGLDRAIRIAEHCGVPLKVAAKVDRADREYYEEQIRPLMNSPLVEYIGEINDAGKSEFLSGAIALLVPIDWPEPFGLVMIEAMACGTPVIAFNRGSAPEVIEDDLTGFIVEDVNGAIGAVDRLRHLSRERIRRRFEERFTARRMALDYLSVYRRLADRAAPHLRLVSDDAPAL
jgi:glycosyltransferase involved in cell wall biosynthesis